MEDSLGLRWSVVLPVKLLRLAKSRLAPLAAPVRAELALAMALDTARAALACPAVARLVVVTDDPTAAPELRALGAVVVPDLPGAGLNPALVHGADEAVARDAGDGVASLSSDLPALRPADLARALAAAAGHPRSVVADAAGAGTTLLTARPATPLRPAYGPRSFDRHRSSGAAPLLLPGLAGLHRDVDTLADLRAAMALGTGPHTSAIAARLLAAGLLTGG